ncbi:2OG-Fe(II) oxygenase (plasmid) [Streptomyces sp. NBC_01527]|uniref:2OG-Fe(II) oxygenase n=1 Tax=Streptomyces sp. NBC_01527 TaxID=2903894 RepID=UPI002F907971
MLPTFSTENFAVFDDFLPEEHIKRLHRYMESENFTYVKSKSYRNDLFRIFEGDPLTGPGLHHQHPVPPKGAAIHPSGTALDAVVDTLLNVQDTLAPWTGKRGEDWDFFGAMPYLYPRDSGLTWHNDSKYQSSYVLYVHEEWKPTWGAELLVATDLGQGEAEMVSLKTRKADIGHYVAPLPNRLVVLKGGTPHMVKRVDPNAGENFRSSVAGFFQRSPKDA